MINKYTWIGVGLLIMAAGCTSPRIDNFSVQPSLGRELPTHHAASYQADQNIADDLPEPTGVLKLQQALALALLKSPALEAYSWEVRAAEARILQAGFLPNPELELELDSYNRDGQGFDSSETIIVLGQAIELGGKRGWRKRVAEAEGELAGWDYEGKRLDVFTETTERFINVLAAQQRLDLTTTAVELAQETAIAVAERVKAGKETLLQSMKADAELEMVRLSALDAERGLEADRMELSASWGSERHTFDAVEGDLDFIVPLLPGLDCLRTRLPRNPDLARWDIELKLREANLASEKAGRVPDLVVAAGFKRYKEDDTDALTFGLGLPLPLFDRNQGNVAAAKYDLAKTKAERKEVQTTLLTELVQQYADLTVSHQKAVTLKEKVVPVREKAFEFAHIGYQQGKFAFLDVLDAQRSMFEVRQELIDALAEYHVALATIQRITATSIDELIIEEAEEK